MADIGKLGSMRQTPPQRIEYGPEAVAGLTDKELYGYDKPQYAYTSKEEQVSVPKALAILVNAPESSIMPICAAFLSRFRIDIDITDTRNFFSGGLPSGATTGHAMRYAVLRLLGVGSQTARIFGYGVAIDSSLAASFRKIIGQKQRERDVFPLEHRDDFPRVRDALAEIESHNIAFKDILPESKFPHKYLLSNQTRNTLSSLENMLVILAIALKSNGSMDAETIAAHARCKRSQVTGLLFNEDSPFQPAIRALLKKQREEYFAKTKKGPGKRM